MTRKEVFTKAHKLAKEIIGEENLKFYSEGLSKALKIVWSVYKQEKEAKKGVSKEAKELLIKKGNSPFIEYMEGFKINETVKAIADELDKFTYKSWKANGGIQMFFSKRVYSLLIK